MKKLSRATFELLQRIFPAEHQATVARILENECADNLPLFEKYDEQALEVVRFAVMKLSQGEIRQLEWWAAMARQDPKDIITAAFGKKPNAHQEWARAVYHGQSQPTNGAPTW